MRGWEESVAIIIIVVVVIYNSVLQLFYPHFYKLLCLDNIMKIVWVSKFFLSPSNKGSYYVSVDEFLSQY